MRQQDRNSIPDQSTLDAVATDLDEIDGRIEVGTAVNCGVDEHDVSKRMRLFEKWTERHLAAASDRRGG